MRKLLMISSLLSLGLLSGCAAMSENECLRGEWYGAGLSDAERGKPISYFYDRAEACGKHKVSVGSAEQNEWSQGYTLGLQRFCTPQQAYQWGLLGNDDPHICGHDRTVATLFSINHSLGRQVYSAIREVDSLESQLRKEQDELNAGTRNSGKETRPMNDKERRDWQYKIDRTRAALDTARYQLRIAETYPIQWQ